MINKNKDNLDIKRGDLVLVDFGEKSESRGSEQYGRRPAIVIQNNTGNKFSPTTIVAPITKRTEKKPLPTHVHIKKEYLSELADSYDSMILLEQVKVIGKSRIIRSLNENVSGKLMNEINNALMISVGLEK